MKNVLICNYQEYFYEAVLSLHKKNIIKPKYWLTHETIQQKVKKNFPNIYTHDYFDAVKGKLLRNIDEDITLKIDTNFLLNFQRHEFIVLNLLERNNAHSGALNYLERKDFFYKMLRYWYSVLKNLNIELVIFEEEPHQASDYILYVMSKYLEIKTYMPILTFPQLGFLTTDDIESPDKSLLKFNDKKITNEIKISSSVQDIISNIKGEFEEAIKIRLYDQKDIFDKKKKLKIRNFIKKIPSYCKLLFNFKSDQKVSNSLFEDSKLLYIQYALSKIFLIRKKKYRQKYYESIVSKEIDLNKKFILFGLQYQPEKSTCPNGGYFVDQILAIKLISQLIPDDFKIYVKEHPSQFVSSYARYGDRMRDLNFYDKIKDIKKVSLISSKENTFKLIDSCVFSASVGGSICIESVIRGKPALQFGKSWYDACEYVFKIKNENDLKKVLNNVDEINVDHEKVISFLKKVDFLSFKGVVGGKIHLQNSNISKEENAKIHARALELQL